MAKRQAKIFRANRIIGPLSICLRLSDHMFGDWQCNRKAKTWKFLGSVKVADSNFFQRILC